MENIMLQTMQHKKILFLISLPCTSKFQECITDVNECLDELRQLHVDVREHIWREDIAEANNYDVVIVVAHRDISSDELVLADGTMLIKDFVSSIPSDFKGVIDFSSCYSSTAFYAIKDRCPQCKVQVAIAETSLLRRLIIYPSIVEYLYDNPTIDYAVAYEEVSKAFDYAMNEIDNKDSDIAQMAHLGEQMTSIFAPEEVKRGSVFQIVVFFHYDFERGVIKVKAKRWQTNTIIRDDFEIPIPLNENDKISVSLSFDSTDNDNIRVKNNEYSKTVAIKKELVVEKFIVILMPDFRGNSFLANIEMAKDDEPFIRCAFNIDIVDTERKIPVDIIAEIPQKPIKPEEIIKNYISVFAGGGNKGTERRSVHGKLFNNTTYNQFLSKITGDNEEEKLSSIRKYVYNSDMFLDTIRTFLKQCEGNLKEIKSKVPRDSEIACDIVPLLKGYVSKLQKKTEILDNKLIGIKTRKGEKRIYEDAAPLFIPLEGRFLELVFQVTNLDYQIDILSAFRELIEAISIQNIIEIKKLSGQFYEHPHYNDTDKDLYDLFKASGTGSIIHPKSQGTTMPFLALVLAMAVGEYSSSDKGKDDWIINVEKYIDFSENKSSLRTPKSRINKLVGLLDNKEIHDKIKIYQKTEAGKISIAAYYLLKVKVKVQ